MSRKLCLTIVMMKPACSLTEVEDYIDKLKSSKKTGCYAIKPYGNFRNGNITENRNFMPAVKNK